MTPTDERARLHNELVDRLHRRLDVIDRRWWRDVDRDRESDKAYTTFNIAVDRLNAAYPNLTPLPHQ